MDIRTINDSLAQLANVPWCHGLRISQSLCKHLPNNNKTLSWTRCTQEGRIAKSHTIWVRPLNCQPRHSAKVLQSLVRKNPSLKEHAKPYLIDVFAGYVRALRLPCTEQPAWEAHILDLHSVSTKADCFSCDSNFAKLMWQIRHRIPSQHDETNWLVRVISEQWHARHTEFNSL